MVHAVIIIIIIIVLLIAELSRNQTNVPRTALTCNTINSSPLFRDSTLSFRNMQILAQGDCQEKFSPTSADFRKGGMKKTFMSLTFFQMCARHVTFNSF